MPAAEDKIIDMLLSTPLNRKSSERLQSVLDRLADEFAMPFCLISFVHSSKSLIPFRHGVDAESFDHPAIGVSFCQHVQNVKRPMPLIVSNASADERFKSHPLVAGPPSVRSYLGAPLRWLDGTYLGTVCLLDSKPCSISVQQCEPLMAAADEVIREYAGACQATASPASPLDLT